MIISRIIGGLGNQMFQYAIGRSLAIKNNDQLKLDINEFNIYTLHKYNLNKFNIVENFASDEEINQFKQRPNKISRLFEKINLYSPKYKIFQEKQRFAFDSTIFKQKGNIYLMGYWQTEKYFSKINDIIKKEFSVKTELKGKNKEICEKISNSNSIAVHVRRGDYISDPKTFQMHGGICDINYYQNGINYLIKQIANPNFFIFSDDPDWCEKNLKITDYPIYFINYNKPDEGYEDLRLMRNCKHFIIANSTFSWWGAWLSEYKGKIIIAPKIWKKEKIEIKDLIPNEWLKF